MNKNIKVAKELIKLAKSLMAERGKNERKTFIKNIEIDKQNNKYAFNLFDKTQRQLKKIVVNYIDQINESVKLQYEQAQNDGNDPQCELHDCSGKTYWNEHKKDILQRLKTDFSKEEWNNLNSDQKFEWLKQLLKEREFRKDIPQVQYTQDW